jgi:hypothetical protein
MIIEFSMKLVRATSRRIRERRQRRVLREDPLETVIVAFRRVRRPAEGIINDMIDLTQARRASVSRPPDNRNGMLGTNHLPYVHADINLNSDAAP